MDAAQKKTALLRKIAHAKLVRSQTDSHAEFVRLTRMISRYIDEHNAL